MEKKICIKCKRELDLDCFYSFSCARSGKIETTGKCKECRKGPKKEKIILTHKECTKCGELKEINEDNFLKLVNKRTGKIYFEGRCKLCLSVYQKNYRQENKEHIEEQGKEYRKEYLKRPEVKQRRTKWAKEQRKTQKYKDKRKQKLDNNPQYKIRKRLSTRIYQELKKKGGSKQGKSILDFLPYTIAELKSHLEAQFEPWMSWENWGLYLPDQWDDLDPSTWTWQIDHIIPHSHFSYKLMEDEDFLKCWSLNNLRPFSAKQNVIDNDRL
jgi:hypothetical protein